MRLTEIKPHNGVTIGGSQIAAILGLSPYKSPLQQWRELTGVVKTEPNAAMRRGLMAEAFIQNFYQQEFGVEYAMIQHQMEIGAARGTFDALTADGVLIDFKSTALCKESVPTAYRLQLIWYAGLAIKEGLEINSLRLVAADGFFNIYVHEMTYDDELFQIMDDKAGEWYDRHIIQGKEPEPTPSEKAEMLKSVVASGIKVTDDEVIKEKIFDLRDYKEKVAGITKKIEALEAEIKAEIGEAEGLADQYGNLLVTWKTYSRKSLDTTALKKAMPEIAAKFEKEQTYRMFKLVN
ncbi:MAG: YqaJ viral recombinase family protein [Candidatus Anstonellaceae archaeon]